MQWWVGVRGGQSVAVGGGQAEAAAGGGEAAAGGASPEAGGASPEEPAPPWIQGIQKERGIVPRRSRIATAAEPVVARLAVVHRPFVKKIVESVSSSRSSSSK